ncbi:MAG: tryptophan 7-halogenase [Sphingomonas sp.]|uniref:tryptophan halogenase family protein n=1 Tax=Sphingomonas sp. TaxID=28214 RepID=UPI001AC1CD82|nr:tryptophan halogenase family protein [Sphingomonas sp.]MBN8807879.1 tryptophan 7-halogenase [Sphingomonas sp.]
MSHSAPLDPAPFRIVIAGGGTAGWTAAATCARFLGNRATISLVESDAIGTIGVGEATIPQIHNLLIGLGLDQAEFLRRTNASFKLGIEFVDWRRVGHSYVHSFGTVGRGVGLIPFRQLWLRGRALGVAGDYGDYSANVAAARRGKFVIGDGRDRNLPDLAYAYHFDATLFAAMLRDYAEANGVCRVEGTIASVERNGASGDIRALTLDGGRAVVGDLFLDCTGFRSLLLGQALDVPFVDWRRYLPCDTALAVPCANSGPLRPYTQSIARPAGWQWRIPLQHRTGNGHVFASEFMSVDEASVLLLANLEGEPLADPRPIRFTTGHRREFWAANCVGLGLAAGFMEPLESTSIHLVQSALGRLLNVLPRDLTDLATARDTFNRLSTIEWQRVRDFLVLHYVANDRVGEPFWDHCRHIDLPATLAEKIALFEESGAFVREEDELFLDDSWGQVMLGQGIEPRSWSPLADNVAGAEIGPFLDTLARAARVRADAMPDHRSFIAAMTGAKAESAA